MLEHRHSLLAGALAGVSEAAVTYPLEFVKTQLQIAEARAGGGGGDGGSGTPQASSWRVARATVKRHGFRGLYRGVSSNLVFGFPRSAVRFGVYQAVLDALHAAPGPAPTNAVFAAGLVAGVVESVTVLVPMNTISVRLIADNNAAVPRFRGLVHAIRELVATEGFRAVYAAPGPTLIKNACNASVRFSLYTEIHGWLSRGQRGVPQDASHATVLALTAGALSGCASVLVNHPVDVVKSRIQAKPPGTYASAVACARAVYASQGARGLYVGLAPRLVRVSFEIGLSFAFFEHFSRACNLVIDGRP